MKAWNLKAISFLDFSASAWLFWSNKSWHTFFMKNRLVKDFFLSRFMKGLKKYALTPLLSNFLARRFFTSPARSWLLLTLGPKVSTYDLKLEYTKQRKNMDNGEYYIERNETRFYEALQVCKASIQQFWCSIAALGFWRDFLLIFNLLKNKVH